MGRAAMNLPVMAIFALGVLFAQVGAACAHSKLISASPAGDSTVPGTFKQVKLGFAEPIEAAMSYFELLNSGKKRLMRINGKDACAEMICQFPVKALPDGKYRIRYHVLSADGHVVDGDYSFTVKNAQ